jgi:hypothetical protein
MAEDPELSRDTLSKVQSSDSKLPQPDRQREDLPSSEKQTESDANTFPDGGWEAWSVVAGGFCIVFASFGWINCEQSGCTTPAKPPY